jgi:hypothetical protein
MGAKNLLLASAIILVVLVLLFSGRHTGAASRARRW